MRSMIPPAAHAAPGSAVRDVGPVKAIGALRRLAIVLCAAWAVCVTGVAVYELVTHQVGYFVALSLPVGTVVLGNEATLPDGRVVKLDRTVDVRSLAPGDIAWSDVPGVVELQPRTTLLAVVLLVPLVGWLSLEGLAVLARWILRGAAGR